MRSKPDLDMNSLHVALGSAMSCWSSLEASLGDLYCACVNPHTSHPAILGFWAVHSFDAKLKMTDAVVGALFPADTAIGQTWASLNDKLRRKNRARNKIAHATVVTSVNEKTREPYYVLIPFFRSRWAETDAATIVPGYREQPAERLHPSDLSMMAESFTKTYLDLIDLSRTIRNEVL